MAQLTKKTLFLALVVLGGLFILAACYFLLPYYYHYKLRKSSQSAQPRVPTYLQPILDLWSTGECRSADDRVAWIVALGNRRADFAAETLIGLTEDDDEGVRSSAREALAKIRAQRVTQEFLRRLKGSCESRRIGAASILGQLKDPAAADSLSEALKDPSSRVRFAALSSLAVLAEPRTAKSVVEALLDPDWLVRAEAVQAVHRLNVTGLARKALLDESGPGSNSERCQLASELLRQYFSQ